MTATDDLPSPPPVVIPPFLCLTFANYRPIMHYNCSNYYALTVGELAIELAADAPPAAPATGRSAVLRVAR